MKELIKKYNPAENYYPAMMIIYAASLISLDLIHPGMVSAVLVAATVIWCVMAGKMNILKEKNTADIIMALWLLYNVISGIWTIGYGMPASVYLGELFSTALPMIFYFAARGTEEIERERFYRYFIFAVTFIGILGVILYITAPQFYIDYLFRLEYVSKADASTMRVRMHSVIGSTLMGYLPVVAMLFSEHFILKSRKKIYLLFFFLNCFLAFMSNQRAAMVAAILVILYVNYLVFFTFKIIDKKYFFMELGGFAVILLGLIFVFHGAFMKVYYRLVSLPGAIGQRSDQWIGAANNMSNIWLGNGLGANGHRSLGIQEHLIADGGLAKLYCEMGILGTSIFIFLMILVFRRGLRNLRHSSAEMGIVAITLIVSIGSNMMSFALAVPVLYYAIGALTENDCRASN
ncbi:hypothetical protein QYZ88_012140 [Lachnospiraceae bacterium C1.1]|nr:hypothetical protein [Lachnospiraceae bacterium C1.1]